MSLQFNVSQLLKGDVGETRSYDFDADERMDLDDGIVAHGIAGHVKFTLTNFGIVATGNGRATLDLTCARCLEPFQTPVEVEFEEEYRPVIDIATGLPSTTPAGNVEFRLSPNHTLDLSEVMRQNFLLAVELIPVCRPDCRGLCPSCGRNRNIETCHCPPAEESSPFAVLQGLLGGVDHEE